MDLATIDSFIDLGIALALGLVIGLERGWAQRHEAEGTRFAGVRTFTLIGLCGGLAALFEKQDLRVIAIATFVIFGAMLIGVIIRSNERDERGITTVVAALLTFLLTFIAGMGEHVVAAAVAVIVAVVLDMKDTLHDWIEKVERAEVDAILRLLVISLVILPILPNEGFGPWNALNPYQIWWMVVLISALSFLGHMAAKWMAPGKGILLTSMVGGLASSTAIAVSFARMGRASPALAPLLGAGVVASSSVMFPRIILVTMALSPALAWKLAPIFLLVLLAGAFAVWWIWNHHHGTLAETVEMPQTSFDLSMPLQFGVILAIVMMVAAGAQDWLGDRGLYVVAAVAGVTDVDAVVVTAANDAREGLSLAVATLAILIVSAVNTISKGAIVGAIAGRKMAIPVALSFALMIGAAALGYGGTILLN